VEHGHYLSFIQLAEQVPPADQVTARWDQMLDTGAWIIHKQPSGPRMHSGMSG
jgi:tRNA isopentenyl-2-thiomethyl-A-37 hydroxylase MiaE